MTTDSQSLPPLLDAGREAFEVWFKARYHPRLDRNMPDKSYNDPTAHVSWPAWQASRKQALEEAAKIARDAWSPNVTIYTDDFKHAAILIEKAIKELK